MDYPGRLRVRNSLDKSDILILINTAAVEGRKDDVTYMLSALNDRLNEILRTPDGIHVNVPGHSLRPGPQG